MNRKRFLVFIVVLVALFSVSIHAYAYIPCICNNPPDQCTCFIQLGDKGLAVKQIIKRLEKIGYVTKPPKKSEFTIEIKEAVLQFQKDNNLECTGWMDDETLDALLSDVLPDESVRYEEERWYDVVCVPTDGGIRYHTNPECSDMYYPRLITRLNAEKLGIHQCGSWECPAISMINIPYSEINLMPRNLPDDYILPAESDEEVQLSRSLPSDDTEVMYIGNKKTHVFHLSTCSSVRDMREKNKVELLSRDEAIEQGYKPCGRCNP